METGDVHIGIAVDDLVESFHDLLVVREFLESAQFRLQVLGRTLGVQFLLGHDGLGGKVVEVVADPFVRGPHGFVELRLQGGVGRLEFLDGPVILIILEGRPEES